MASGDYIPAKDADLDLWANNFSTLLTASPATYGLVAGDATAVAGVFATWHTAYLAAINPATRTPVTVQAKDDARTAMLAVVRPYAIQISNNAGVNPSDKAAIGVNTNTSTPTPFPPPTSAPIIDVISAQVLVHNMTYRDSDAPESIKAKPAGVKFLELHAGVSATVIEDQDLIPYKAMYSKSPYVVQWEAADAGKTAYFAARWINDNGEVGPWSSIIAYTVAQGASVA